MPDNKIIVKAEARKKVGGRSPLNLRMAGRIPGIVYGQKQDPVAVSVDHKEFTELFATGVKLVHLDQDGKDELVIIKDVQLNHLSSDIIHIDFNRVDVNKKVRVEMAVEFRGRPAGAEEGGVLDVVMNHIEIECLPLDIPSEPLRVNVEKLKLDEVLHVRDLKLPEKIHAVTPGESVVAVVKVPAEQAEAPAAEAGAAEPEVLKKGKGEVEGDAKADEKKPEKK
jgi:large subunit ribosomal protein L25